MSDPTLELVRARRAEIGRIRESLDAEERDLEITERTLMRLAVKTTMTSSGTKSGVDQDHKAKPVLNLEPPAQLSSQKSLITTALQNAPEAWFESSDQLHAFIASVFNVEIPKSSFLPYLSDLKKREVIVRDGQRIALKDRVRR